MASVLIVDDEERFRTECAEFFDRAGWQVFTAENGDQATEFLAGNRAQVDALILDRNMPGKSGDEIVQWLYDQQRLNDICVIMLTAYSDYESAVETLQAGAWQYVSKPCALPTLLSLLAPGVGFKKCHNEHRQILAASDRDAVVERVRNIIYETLAPDTCKVIFLSPCDSAETQEHVARTFVQKLMNGQSLVAGGERAKVKTLQPILPEACSLMAVPVKSVPSPDTQPAIIGILDIESQKPNAFSSRWVDVLRYAADLIGTFEAVRDARQVQEIGLMNQELLHRLTTHVQIVNQRVTEARRQFRADPSTEDPLNVIASHMGVIDSVMNDLSRMIREHPRLEIADVSPYEVLAQVGRGDGHIPVVGTERASEPLFVRADSEELRYCLDCVVQNAFDAIEEAQLQPSSRDTDHHVNVSVDADPQWVRIRIQDTGIGFTPDIHQRLFVPLFSTKKTRKGRGGIGLYSVKRIIQAMGGRIDGESHGELRGATFTISLLRAKSNAIR